MESDGHSEQTGWCPWSRQCRARSWRGCTLIHLEHSSNPARKRGLPGRASKRPKSGCRRMCEASPADRFTSVLFVQPLLERREIVEDRGGVHVPLPGQPFNASGHGRLTPICSMAFSRSPALVVVDGAAIQRPGASGGPRQAPGETGTGECRPGNSASTGHSRHVIFCAGIEILFAARLGRRYALILQLQIPPGLVVISRRDLAGENLPSPLVDQQAERQERDLLERAIRAGVRCLSMCPVPCPADRSSPDTRA